MRATGRERAEHITEMENCIIHGDCLEEMPKIPNKSIDLILCDLPYAVTSRNNWDVIIPFEKLWLEYNRITKENTAIVLTAIQPFTSMLIMSNIKMFKYCWVWEKSTKTNFLNAKIQPLRKHEDVVVFGNTPRYYPQGLTIKNSFTKQGKTETSNYGNQDRQTGGYMQEFQCYPHDIIKFTSESSRTILHPTQKPVALFEYLIKTYSDEGDVILDNCAGSFTTAIAALNTNRKYICIEKDENYFNIGKKRIQDWHDKKSGELF